MIRRVAVLIAVALFAIPAGAFADDPTLGVTSEQPTPVAVRPNVSAATDHARMVLASRFTRSWLLRTRGAIACDFADAPNDELRNYRCLAAWRHGRRVFIGRIAIQTHGNEWSYRMQVKMTRGRYVRIINDARAGSSLPR